MTVAVLAPTRPGELPRPPATRRRALAAVVSGALLATALAGCGGSGPASSTQRDAAPPAPDNPAGGPAAGPAAGTAGGAASVPGAGAPPGKDAGKGPSASDLSRVVPTERAVIRTADLVLRVGDLPGAARRADDVARSAGGYVADERSEGLGTDRARLTITVRVPTDRFDDVLRQLGGLGTQVQVARSQTDVTAQVVDVASRVETQRRSVARVRELLAKATSIADIVSLESELSRREADLEALLARQKALADQTDLARLTVTLLGPRADLPPPPSVRGFLPGLQAGWTALLELTRFGLTVTGAVLPFALLGGLLAVPWWWGRRRRGHRASTAPPVP